VHLSCLQCFGLLNNGFFFGAQGNKGLRCGVKLGFGGGKLIAFR
jgi:hypothetical protein